MDISDSFSEYKIIKLDDSTFDYSFSDIIIVEIEELNKKNIQILNDIVKANSTKEICIFSTDIENKFLLKFALYFSLNRLNPLDIDVDSFKRFLKELSKKIELKKEVEISHKINSFFAIILIHEEKITFINEKAKYLLNIQDITEAESFMKNNKTIYSLMAQGEIGQAEVPIRNSDGEKCICDFYIDILENSGDKLIIVIPQHKMQESKSSLSITNRFEFIENLKNCLAQNALEKSQMSVTCISISNYKKLQEASNATVMHDFIKKFIASLLEYENMKGNLTQWDSHCFVFLTQKSSFEDVKQKLDLIHQKLINNEINKEINPIIISSALDIDKLDLNDIISSIDEISQHNFNNKKFNSSNYFEINHLDEQMNEDEQIYHYLQSALARQSEFKLLNIYKGLCINTASKVLKIRENSYFVYCENLQAYSMKMDNKTVIQSADLPKNIEADIKYISLEKKYAVLENLRYLEFSANNRQHTRVQPSIRMPVGFRYEKYSLQGELIDISTQAIAMKFNHSLNGELGGKEVMLSFKLPDESMSEGFSNMDITGKVVHVSEIDITKSKVVVMINLESPYDSYMLKYIYDRQKELILELKRAVRAHKKV